MRRKLHYLLTLPLLALAACGQSPDEQLRSEVKAASSWAATAQAAAEAWAKGYVTHAYARRTLEAAQASLQEAADALEAAEEIPAARRSQAGERIGSLRQTVNSMRAAVEGGDRQSLAQSLGQLDRQRQELEALTKGAGGGR